jgi:hypothetical protein
VADEPRPVAKSSVFYGTILAASRLHYNTAQTFDLLRQEAERLGVRFGPTIATDVSRIRSGTTRLAAGSELIARSTPDQAITSRMIGRMPYGKTALGPGEVPTWMVDFELNVTRGDSTDTEWHHLRYVGSLPATVGALQEDIAAYSDLLADSYTVSVGELGDILIGTT